MAREKMVTRTMQTTEVEVLCLDLETQLPFTQKLTLTGTFKDNKQLMKAVTKQVDKDNKKAVHVTSTKEIETLYGMLEDDFVKNAKILPPRETQSEAPKKA